MSEAGLAQIDALRDEGAVPDETAERTRAMRDFRRRRFAARLDGDTSIDERSARYQSFMLRHVIGAERDALVPPCATPGHQVPTTSAGRWSGIWIWRRRGCRRGRCADQGWWRRRYRPSVIPVAELLPSG